MYLQMLYIPRCMYVCIMYIYIHICVCVCVGLCLLSMSLIPATIYTHMHTYARFCFSVSCKLDSTEVLLEIQQTHISGMLEERLARDVESEPRPLHCLELGIPEAI